MYHLMYYSIASRGLTEVDISDILTTARRFNATNKITGCLLFHNDTFVQLLEGEELVVKDLYAKIKKDPRHQIVTFLAEDNNDQRVFSNFDMAYHKLTASDMNELNKSLFIEKNVLSLAKLAEKPTHTIKIFWHMAKQILEE